MTRLRIAWLTCHSHPHPTRAPYGLTWIRADGTRRIPRFRSAVRASRIHGLIYRHHHPERSDR